MSCKECGGTGSRIYEGKPVDCVCVPDPYTRIAELEARAETGPMEFPDDWPGIFIRGDNALAAAICFEQASAMIDKLSGQDTLMSKRLLSYSDLMRSCHASACKRAQKAKLTS